MNTLFTQIRSRISSIQFGLLRYRNEEAQQSFQIRVTPGDKDILHCMLTGDETADPSIDHPVHLIQKHKDDYLFISGHVVASVTTGKKQMVSMQINRARWFKRCFEGSVSWFVEKHTYISSSITRKTAALRA